jgi:hypothetical protein
MDDFIAFLKARIKKFKLKADDLIIMCSSSMDFPEQETKDKKVIALARELRSE